MNASLSKQLLLNLRTIPLMGREDYIVSKTNKEAVTWLDIWPNWPSIGFIVCGPSGSGKSHMAAALKTLSNGLIIEAKDLSENKLNDLSKNKCLIIEDIDRFKSENLLLYIYNMLTERRHKLMITSNTPIANIDFKLPDLKSRLNSMTQINIGLPDDELLTNLIIKQFTDRGVIVEFEAINYLIKRIDRSFESIAKLVSAIDASSLEKSKKITIPFIKKVLKL